MWLQVPSSNLRSGRLSQNTSYGRETRDRMALSISWRDLMVQIVGNRAHVTDKSLKFTVSMTWYILHDSNKSVDWYQKDKNKLGKLAIEIFPHWDEKYICVNVNSTRFLILRLFIPLLLLLFQIHECVLLNLNYCSRWKLKHFSRYGELALNGSARIRYTTSRTSYLFLLLWNWNKFTLETVKQILYSYLNFEISWV